MAKTSLQEQVKDLCKLADAVVENPSSSVSDTAKQIGLSAALVTFAGSGLITFAPLLLGPLGPLSVAGLVLKKIYDKKERERQEKERMLREVISKQQAVINKLHDELAKSRQQNANNRQEIENLKEMLKMLEETENHLNAA